VTLAPGMRLLMNRAAVEKEGAKVCVPRHTASTKC
jgi:hypothetical protein